MAATFPSAFPIAVCCHRTPPQLSASTASSASCSLIVSKIVTDRAKSAKQGQVERSGTHRTQHVSVAERTDGMLWAGMLWA